MTWRGWLAFLGVLALIGGGVWGWSAWIDAEERAEEDAAAARREERTREAEERVGRLIEESRELMPEVVEGAALGMHVDEVRAARAPRITPSGPRSGGPLMMYEERLPNGGQVMYGFDPQSQRLVQVQVLSLLPTVDAVAPHLAAMNERYGPPTGIWDCPTTGGVPTRRFTWRRSYTTVSDVFLIYGERVSLTLYIATSEQIGQSLQISRCTPVTRDRIGEFPMATPEQMQQAAQSGR
ncbi:MAG: hypothetical protein M3Y87_35065 [Myxococcota bacterium]|nr:hypothetical protein [Myxococcota bacterium]